MDHSTMLAMSPSGLLYITGNFIGVIGVPNSRNFVVFDPSNQTFSAFPINPGKVSAIAFEPNTERLYIAGGNYAVDNGLPTSVSFWNNTGWKNVAFVNGKVLSIVFNGSQLIVSGPFSRIQGSKK